MSCMKLKRLIYNVSLCIVGVLLAACSNIADDERFVEVEPIIPPDSISDDSVIVVKRVLIEDFTGQRCINCPNGAEAIVQIQKSYGEDRIIAVGLYSGPLGRLPNGMPLPLYNEDANWYYEQRGVSVQPTAMIDRGGLNSNSDTWSTDVFNRIRLQPELDLKASCNYDEASRNVDITVEGDGLADVSGKLQVWLVEDNIVSLQMMPGGDTNQEYVHNHVFRATVNNREGEDISMITGEHVTRTFSYAVSDEWKPEDMSVVVFVFNDSGVLQAAKAPLLPEAGETGDEGGNAGGDAGTTE